MRVLVISNLYPPDVIGGYELCCRQVVDALRRRRHDMQHLEQRAAGPLSRPRARLAIVQAGQLLRRLVHPAQQRHGAQSGKPSRTW